MIFVVVSTGHFDPLITECSRLSQKFEFLGQIGSCTVAPPFPHFRMASPTDLERYMNQSELVVTHAGTGMLSMLYRLKKKSVVIPKQMRYGEANDGQAELAKKWAELGMSILCMDVENLESSIVKCRRLHPNFPRFPSLGNHLRGLIELDPEGSSLRVEKTKAAQ